MRKSIQKNGLTLNAIAGSNVVILGFNMKEEDCEGLLGFSIHRKDHAENECYYMKGMKIFEETDPGFPSGSLYSTKDHPWQSFQWADYSAKPGHIYTYTKAGIFLQCGDFERFFWHAFFLEIVFQGLVYPGQFIYQDL